MIYLKEGRSIHLSVSYYCEHINQTPETNNMPWKLLLGSVDLLSSVYQFDVHGNIRSFFFRHTLLEITVDPN